MKKKFTILITAAFMLLSMIVQPGKAWGQTRTTQIAVIDFETGEDMSAWTLQYAITTNTQTTAYHGSKYFANSGTTAYLKYNNLISSPQSLTCYVTRVSTNTKSSTWYVQVSSDGNTWTDAASTSATDMSQHAWKEFSADLSDYSDVYVRIKYDGSSAVRALDYVTLTYDDGTAPSTDPTITFTPASINLGEVMVGNQASTTFSVSQANLTSGITLTVDNGNLSPSSIEQGAAATSVTWTYTPTAAGDFSATVTATSGNTSETLEISGTAIAPVEGYDVDFEYATNVYPNWTFNNMESYQTGSITAHGGTYYGTTGGKASASITTTETVANPGTLTCYVSKQSGNTTSSTWYIQVSENGSTWTNVESHSATSMSQGSWEEFTADLTEYTDVYVRVYYSGSTAVRNIDDLTLTTAAPSNIFTVTYNGNGNTGGSVPTDSNEYENGDEVTVYGNTGNLVKTGYVWAGWCMNAEGTGTVYGPDYTTTFEISANTTLYAMWEAKTITGLTYEGTPTGPQYAGQAFNPAGLTVTATFNDASQEDVTSQVVWTPNPLSIETTSVTGTYMGQQVTVDGITVTYAPGTENNPYTVAQARAAIDAGTGITGVYATGTVSEIVTAYNPTYGNISYNISTDGTTTADQLQAYRGKSYNGDWFTSADDIQVGDIVIVYGNLKKYNTTYEFDQDNQLVSLIRKVANPTFSPAAGAVNAGTQVAISCATTGATIYYTTNGTDPTTSSNVYSEPIIVNEAMTIKAFAHKDGSPDSDIVTAAYTIALPVATPTFSPDAGTYNFAQNVIISCETSGSTIRYTIDGTDPSTSSAVYSEPIAVNATMTIKAIGIKEGLANSAVASATYTMNIPVIDASNVNLAYDATNGSIAYTLTNDVEGGELTAAITEGNWLIVGEVGESAIPLTCSPNEGEADRTATVTLTYTYDTHTVTKVVTVTQAHFVVDYATLPFNWAGGTKEDLTSLVGVTGNGLGSNYAESNAPYRVKFDTDGDYILIKTDQQPGEVTVGIKKLGGANASSITISGSSDGQNFTPIQEFDNDGTTNAVLEHTTTVAFGANDRYVRIYFNKPDGGSNVGVGPISIAQYVAPSTDPYITIADDEIQVTAAGDDDYVAIAYGYLDIVQADDFGIQFCDAVGNELAEDPTWILANVTTQTGQEGYFVYYVIDENDGDARTTYFKVYALGDDYVYSNLVTVSQTAFVPTFTINFNLDGGTFVPNDVFTDAIVEVEAGTYALPSATKTGSSFAGWKLDDTETIYASGQNYEVNADASFTAQWTAVTTYSLVTNVNQIISGMHYIIASGTSTSTSVVKAMGAQTANNRAAVTVSVSNNNQIQETTGVYEFVINGPETITKDEQEVEVYTIYDVNYSTTGGYLHAATSGSSNYLKTRQLNSDANSQWTISIDTVTNIGKATIKAQGDFTKNWMRYNSNSSIFSCYASGQNDIYLYVKDNDTDLEYYGCEITYDEDHIPADTTITIGAGSVMQVTSAFTNTDHTNLIIEDGGQLINNSTKPVAATVKKNIVGHNPSAKDGVTGYCLISSPINNMAPADAHMIAATAEDYDLYKFDQTEDKEWQNYKQHPFNLVSGQGYLYANKENETLEFAGTIYNGDGKVTLTYDDNAAFNGVNLVGNPFTQDAYIDRSYYVMKEDGSEIVPDAVSADHAIKPMQGIFVVTNTDGQEMTFSKTYVSTANNNGSLTLNVNQAVNTRGESRTNLIDRAIVRFGVNDMLPKFQLNDNSSKIYFTEGNKDYAVVSAEAQGEMPVYFKAAENGTYTLSFSMNNVEFGYLHLIDNKTGNDVDLRQTPSYTFEASTIDYASRFRLVFRAIGNDNDSENNDFGFFDANGNLLILGIEGTATLQVMDVMGRVISNETFSGDYSKAINASAGVYMLRLIQGSDIRTQKVVVK